MSSGLQSVIAGMIPPLTIWVCICLGRIGRSRVIEAEARLLEAKNAAHATAPRTPAQARDGAERAQGGGHAT